MEVKPIPGLEHLPLAEAWFHVPDELLLAEAGTLARALGKTGLEVWTTSRTPSVVPFLEARGFVEARRYVISELDVAAAPEPPAPRFATTTFAARPDLADDLFALARVAYSDQPGRSETRIEDAWYEWGLRAHPPESYVVALEGERLLGYGYLELERGQWRHGFTAVAREARGRGVAGAIKRAQITWAKRNGVWSLQTANERRLTGMLALNDRLGYRRLYEEIVLRGPA